MTTDVDSPGVPPVQRTGGTDLLPFAWEPGPDTPDLDERETFFRFPAADDPSPGTGRVLTLALYTAMLGIGGVGVGVRALGSVVIGGVPGWYVPVLALVGLVGVTLAVGAFLSVHRTFLPWCLLAAAAVPLTGDILIAAAY
jgi:hypothetical protein